MFQAPSHNTWVFEDKKLLSRIFNDLNIFPAWFGNGTKIINASIYIVIPNTVPVLLGSFTSFRHVKLPWQKTK